MRLKSSPPIILAASFRLIVLHDSSDVGVNVLKCIQPALRALRYLRRKAAQKDHTGILAEGRINNDRIFVRFEFHARPLTLEAEADFIGLIGYQVRFELVGYSLKLKLFGIPFFLSGNFFSVTLGFC